MRKAMVLSVVTGLVTVILLVSPTLAAIWRFNLGVGYGSYSPSLGKINELVQSCNSWTEDTFGLNDFQMEKMETGPLYSLDGRTEIGPLWEVGLNLNAWGAKRVSIDKEVETGSETIRIYGHFSATVGFMDLMVFRKFPRSKLAPFVGAGLGYYGVNIFGDYDVWSESFTPPWDWEYRNVYETFEVLEFTTGYVLTAGGVWSALEHLRISIEAKYHSIPEFTAEFEDTYREGFDSFPMEPEPFKVDLSGLTAGITLMLRF